MKHSPFFGVGVGVLLLVVWVLVGSIGFALIEGWSYVDALYMSVITLSTVGFGEVHELSPVGRMFASFIIIAGIGTAVYTFTGLGQLLLEGELLAILGRRRMKSELEKLRRHQIVCGYGRVGKPVVGGIHAAELPFCVIDRDPALEEHFRERGYPYVIGDATDEEVLNEAGIEHARSVLALLGSDADNLYLTVSAKTIQPGIEVTARALDEKAETKLRRGGAERVVSPYRIAATQVLHAIMKPTVVDMMEVVSHPSYMHVAFGEFKVTERSKIAGRSISEAEIRQLYHVIVIAIKRASGEMVFNPESNERLCAGDIVVGMGQEEDLRRLEQACDVG